MIARRSISLEPGFFVDLLTSAPDDGDSVNVFESCFSKWVGTRGAVAFSSGRSAMAAVLRALPRADRHEVVVPAYTLKTLVPVIEKAGFTVRFADVSPDTFNVTEETLAKMLSEKTLAVIAADMFGNPCDASAIADVAHAAGAVFIEDAAHATGSTLDGLPLGLHADATFFSFDSIKPVSAYGGGIVVSSDADLVGRIRELVPRVPGRRGSVLRRVLSGVVERSIQMTPLYRAALMVLSTESLRNRVMARYMESRDSTVPPVDRRWLSAQARLAERSLGRLEDEILFRREVAGEIIDGLSDVIRFQRPIEGGISNGYFLVGRLEKDVLKFQRSAVIRGIDVGCHEEITDFAPPIEARRDYPAAWEVFRTAVQLPCHPRITPRQAIKIVSEVRRLLH